jgi:hypothetical protein
MTNLGKEKKLTVTPKISTGIVAGCRRAQCDDQGSSQANRKNIVRHHRSGFHKQGATMTENKEKLKRGQSFSMNFQDQGVNMDHPKTQRMKLTKSRQAKRKKEAKTKRGRSPVWSPILLSDKSVSADTN